MLISTGTKNLQEQIYFKDIPALRDALGIPVHRHLHEGTRELPVPAQARSARTTAPVRRFTTCFCRSSASGRPAPRPAIARSCSDLPEDLAVLERGLGDRRHLPRRRVSALRRLLRHPDAPARRGVRTSSSSTTTCCARTRPSGQNAYGEVIPACSRAIIDEAHQLEDVATQHFGFSVSNYRFEELARDVAGRSPARRPSRTGRRGRRSRRRSRACAITRTAFFTEVAFAHRGDGRAENGRAGARHARIARPDATTPPSHLTGALDILESTLQLVTTVRLAALRLAASARQERLTTSVGHGSRRGARGRPGARAPGRRAADRAAFPAPRERRRLRLLRRVPRTRRVPARVADRRLRDRPRRC